MKHLKIFENFNNDNEVEAIWGIDPYELFDLCLSTMDTVSLYAKLRLDFGIVIYKTQTRWKAPSWEQTLWNSIYTLNSDNLKKYDDVDVDSLLNSKNSKAFEIILSNLGATEEDDKKVKDFNKLIADRLESYGIDFVITDSDYSSTDTSFLTIYLNNI
jgi:hypothetical protein